MIAAAPDWSLEHAAAEMSRRGVRHLVVFDGGEAVGVLSMRDIVRVWTSDGRDLGDDARLRRREREVVETLGQALDAGASGVIVFDRQRGAARTCWRARQAEVARGSRRGRGCGRRRAAKIAPTIA